MKKMLISLILCMFLAGMFSGIIVSTDEDETELVTKYYKDKRPFFPVYTEKGVEWVANEPDDLVPKEKPDKPGKPPKPPKPPEYNDPPDGVLEKYALCIGISDYEGIGSDLTYPDKDAMDWKNFLASKGYTVKVLTNGQATAAGIETEIDALLAKEDGDDYVVFTYSGHGTKVKRYGSSMVSYNFWGLTHGWFKAKFEQADAEQIFFTFDACVIGGFQDSVTDGRVGAFASNRKDSYDGIGSMTNGVFTYYQLEGWGNGLLTFEDDSDYAVQGMKAWASQYIGLSVDPFYKDSFTGDMFP